MAWDVIRVQIREPAVSPWTSTYIHDILLLFATAVCYASRRRFPDG